MALRRARGDDGWRERPVKLPKNHGWRASPGNSVFVAGRGDAMFEVPSKWLVTPTDNGAIQISDRRPPKERMRMTVSVIRFAPHLSATSPVEVMLEDIIVKDVGRTLTSHGPIQTAQRPDFELAWMEGEFIDKQENRKAHMRMCLACKDNLCVIITSDFYPEVSRPAIRAWVTMLGTLEIAVNMDDPALRSRMN